MDGSPSVSLIDPSIRADPYPRYRLLREEHPVHRDETIPGGAWVVLRYADVAPALRDPRLSGDRMPLFRLVLRDTDEARDFDDSFSRWLLNLEPPRHTGLRALVSKAFTPRIVEDLRPRIQAITDAALDDAEAAGHMDVIRDLAYPLPVTVIAELLGLSLDDIALLRGWSADIARFFGTMRGVKRAMSSEAAFREYLRAVIAERRVRPRADLLSALLAAEDHGKTLSEADVLATSILLFVAGHETTTHLIGNGLFALLKHPDQLALLRDDPRRAPAAVEELLRYDGTAQFVGRIARQQLEIGGRRIEPGQVVVLVIAAANRDPAQFPDPDRLDLLRSDNRHLAFGMGSHYCLGAPLARVEAAIAFNTMLRRWPRIRLAPGALEWQDNSGFRGLSTLPIAID